LAAEERLAGRADAQAKHEIARRRRHARRVPVQPAARDLARVEEKSFRVDCETWRLRSIVRRAAALRPLRVRQVCANFGIGTLAGARMNVLKAIALKVISALLFAVMSALVRFLGERYPVGQIVFFRSAFAILPVVVIYAWRNELAAAVRTTRPFGHAGRGAISMAGMFCNFSALARLPIVDATAISFAAPLITVAMSAAFLRERVRVYRWSAVIAGFVGILVMLGPHFDLAHAGGAATGLGVTFAIAGAFCNAGSVIQ